MYILAFSCQSSFWVHKSNVLPKCINYTFNWMGYVMSNCKCCDKEDALYLTLRYPQMCINKPIKTTKSSGIWDKTLNRDSLRLNWSSKCSTTICSSKCTPKQYFMLGIRERNVTNNEVISRNQKLLFMIKGWISNLQMVESSHWTFEIVFPILCKEGL